MIIKNKGFVVALLVLSIILISCTNNNGADSTDMVHIGVLSGSPIFDTAIDGFKAEMTELGYVEGENISYEVQSANGDPEAMRTHSEKFVADEVDLLFTTTNGAAIAAREATAESQIPVVFTFVIAPVESGVVDDLREPGGNVTGVRNPLDDYVARRLEVSLQIAPDTKSIWAPHNPQYSTVQTVLVYLEEITASMDVELIASEVNDVSEVSALIEVFKQADELPVDSIFIFPDLLVQRTESWEAILAFANEYDLMILANTPAQVEAGALFSYLTNNEDTGQQAARMAEQILKGANAGDLPVEIAEVSLMLNLKSAIEHGFDVPPEVVAAAQIIIREDNP